MRPHFEGDSEHFRRHRHLQIERTDRCRHEPRDIFIPDVAAILAEMRGDIVGACLDGWPPRALRNVAMWSMLMPRRIGATLSMLRAVIAGTVVIARRRPPVSTGYQAREG